MTFTPKPTGEPNMTVYRKWPSITRSTATTSRRSPSGARVPLVNAPAGRGRSRVRTRLAHRRWSLGAVVSAPPFAILLLSLVAVPSVAGASVGRPASFALGLVDDELFRSPLPDVRSFWLTRSHRLGSSTVRITAVWNAIAPYVLPP